MTTPAVHQNAEAIRRFNRFYTQQIGLLDQGHLKSPFSLTEVRVMYELANRNQVIASELAKDLGLDAGYLSRIIRKFEKLSFLKRALSQSDGRQSYITLTKKGQAAFASLNQRAHEKIERMLDQVAACDQQRMVRAMETVQALLDHNGDNKKKAAFLLRSHQPGDIGWVIHRHGLLYSQEYGYDDRFEALVAEIAAKFIRNYDPKRERCWMAEKDGDIVGSIFLVKESGTVAKLRLLLVEPSARGLGIGERLVGECVRFARQAGYKELVLWTQSSLHAARRIYEKYGFTLQNEEEHNDWGPAQTSQNWQLQL